jgi:hypothetical protein
VVGRDCHLGKRGGHAALSKVPIPSDHKSPFCKITRGRKESVAPPALRSCVMSRRYNVVVFFVTLVWSAALSLSDYPGLVTGRWSYEID